MKLSPTDMLLMVRSSSLGMNRISSTAKSGMKVIKVSSCSIYILLGVKVPLVNSDPYTSVRLTPHEEQGQQ